LGKVEDASRLGHSAKLGSCFGLGAVSKNELSNEEITAKVLEEPNLFTIFKVWRVPEPYDTIATQFCGSRKLLFAVRVNVAAFTRPGIKGGAMNKKSLLCATAALLIAIALLATTVWADDKEKDDDRLQNAGTVLKEVLNIPDDIPQDLLDKADCVVVFPSVLKAAFVVGGSYGRGAMTCRRGGNFSGSWGAPSMMALEGGSLGFQIGGQATDFVLLVMNDRGANGILSSKVKLGADASVAAGPVGRDASAETDVSMRAEILSYSRARGLFAGISLEGSTIRPDKDANKRIYGEKVSAKDIVLANETHIPSAAEGLISSLNIRTPKHKAS
jgi:lipid-binding SYLF domain-containing protein